MARGARVARVARAARAATLPTTTPAPRAKYVVARFCPSLVKRPASSPSLMGRGSSLACKPSFRRISSARSPPGLSFSKPAIRSMACAMSPEDRRESRPPRRPGAGAAASTARVFDAGRPVLRAAAGALPREESETSSSSEAPRIASSTLAENEAARSLRRLRRDVDMGARDKLYLQLSSTFRSGPCPQNRRCTGAGKKRRACVETCPSVAKPTILEFCGTSRIQQTYRAEVAEWQTQRTQNPPSERA